MSKLKFIPVAAFLSCIFCFSFVSWAFADTDFKAAFERANVSYKENKFDQAINEYNGIINRGFENGNIYYNLANSYLKKGELGRAILNYERARLFMGQDSDLQSNYEYALSLGNLGKDEYRGNLWIGRLEKAFYGLNVNQVVVILFVFQSGFFLIITLKTLRKKQMMFYKAALLGIAFCFVLSAVGLKRKIDYRSVAAIAIDKEIEVKFEPFSGATTHFVISQGSKVDIIEFGQSWVKVRRSDGKTGWVNSGSVEKIFRGR